MTPNPIGDILMALCAGSMGLVPVALFILLVRSVNQKKVKPVHLPKVTTYYTDFPIIEIERD